MSANPNGIHMPRTERHAQVVTLKDQGLTFKQIAEKLGVAMSTVTSAYYDPTGAYERERKRRVHGRCVDCGAQTYNSGSHDVPERCQPCAHRWAGTLEVRRAMSQRTMGQKRYSDEQIFDVLWLLAINGCVTKTRYEVAYRSARRGVMPAFSTLVHRFGSWRNAVHAAGLRIVNESHPEAYVNRADDAAILDALAECATELGHWPTHAEYEPWAKGGRGPSRNILSQRFGSFFAAIEAAMERADQTREEAA